MASAAASGAVAAGVFSAVPVVGWAVGIGAALIDTYYIMPALQGKKRADALSPKLLDSPTSSNSAGAPRIYALGSRIRVPCHIMWQTSKVRETSTTNTKAGTSTNLRRVLISSAISLNDRPSRSLETLYGNGALLIYKSLNLIGVTTSDMTLTVVSADRIRIQATNTTVPSFTTVFDVGTYVELVEWVQTAGSDILLKPFRIVSITDHGGGVGSSITLEKRWPDTGVTMTGVVATAGNGFAPAKVRRIDDTYFFDLRRSTGPTFDRHDSRTDSHLQAVQLFSVGEECREYRWNATSQQYELVPRGTGVAAGFQRLKIADRFLDDPTFPAGIWARWYASNNLPPSIFAPGKIQKLQNNGATNGLFAGTFDPESTFYSGTDTQVADPVIASVVEAVNTPAFRGQAYQVLPDLIATAFGDSMPFSLEAVLSVDASMTYGQALSTILQDRAALPASAIDVASLVAKPLGGIYLRGPVASNTAIQPILMAGQLLVQDRDGVLAFNEFNNADEVAIENGVVFSNFGTRLDGEQAADDKWTVEDTAVEDLPTKIGVRHQDPDNQYVEGYQFFGLRNPEGVDHTNEQELDLSQMVLTRQEAANLASTVLRRAWVNRRTYRFVLPAAYIDLLESDLLTWTDDEGVDHVARIIQRDIGSDFRVGITAIAEDLDLAVAGSPVQSAAGSVPQLPGAAAGVDVVIVDGPAYLEGQNRRPGLHIAVGTFGGNWSGAAIYESVDGTTYDLIDVVGKRATTGTLETTLPSGTTAEYVGMGALTPSAASCTITLTSYGANQMTSRTTKEVVSGLNWCALVKPDGTVEIAAFTSVTALGDNQFTVSGWLRGLRGTGHPYSLTVNEAPAGTRFVLLNGETYFREFAGEITPTALSYKIVPAGLGLEDVDQINVVSARRNALPLPVRTLTKTIDPVTFDARLTVTHNWCRAVLPLGTQPPHPMDEPLEAYRFTIYDTTGTQVRRVKTITASGTGSNTIRDRWIDYPASEQSADGYTPGASTLFTVDVQQIGEFGLGPSVIRKY